jgi:hypothetical protein
MARRLVIPIAAGLRKKPAIIMLVFLAFVGLLAIAVRLFIDDYLTSVWGYQLIPTNQSSQDLAWFVGALPQLVQVAFGFMAIERRNRGFAIVALLAFVIDVGTDVTFRTHNIEGFWIYPIALVQTIILFTLGSEFLLLASLENVVEYLPDVLEATATTSNRLMDSITQVADIFSDEDSEDHPPARRRPRAGGPP